MIFFSKKKKEFNKTYPVGSIFATKLKQKFLCGKWKCLGKDQNNCYLYERIK